MTNGKRDKKFRYTYSSLHSGGISGADGSSVGDILQRLREIESEVRTPALLAAFALAIVGMLTFGAGLSLALVWNNIPLSVVLGSVGIAAAAASLPVYKFVCRRRRDKYAAEKLDLERRLLSATSSPSSRGDYYF